MLDDQNYLNNLDQSDMIGAAQATPAQLKHVFDVDLSSINVDQIQNVVMLGMGGSALAGLIFESWTKNNIWKPFTAVRDYEVPGWVNENTLVIASSYSGNTEETISAFKSAAKRNAQVVVMANGGQLSEAAEKFNLPLYKLPDSPQPRMAAFYGLRALTQIFEYIGAAENLVKRLEETAENLEETIQGWTKDTDTKHNLAKQLAERAQGKNIVVMGGPLLWSAAYKWKISINESSKQVAFFSQWPEFNHNEFIGWSNKPDNKPFVIFQLRSNFESVRMQQRFDISNHLLAGKMPEPLIIEAYGETPIEQLLWTIILGDHVSTYLGLLNGEDPAPVELVEELKKQLRDTGDGAH